MRITWQSGRRRRAGEGCRGGGSQRIWSALSRRPGGPEAFAAAVSAMLDDARGCRLAEMRKRRGMTQEQVAERMGVSVAPVSRRSRAGMCPLRTY